MLKTGLSHGVAIVPGPPKEKYQCPYSGAHFSFDVMCDKIKLMEKKRAIEYNLTVMKILNKDFHKHVKSSTEDSQTSER